MDFIQLIITQDYDSVLSRLTKDVKLNLQSVGDAEGIKDAAELLKKQYDYLKNQINEIKIFRQFEDDKHAIIEYDILLNNTFDLPLVVVLVKGGANNYSSIRTYHSVYPITEGHVFRPSVFEEFIELTEPEQVIKYFKSIGIGSVQDTMDTLSFEDDVYFREPAGWRWKHQTQDGLRQHFEHFFEEGGIPLKFHNYIYDKEKGSFAGEYSCDVWGNATFKPQAGLSIYDINKETGKIKAIRVYDNVDPSYT